VQRNRQDTGWRLPAFFPGGPDHFPRQNLAASQVSAKLESAHQLIDRKAVYQGRDRAVPGWSPAQAVATEPVGRMQQRQAALLAGMACARQLRRAGLTEILRTAAVPTHHAMTR